MRLAACAMPLVPQAHQCCLLGGAFPLGRECQKIPISLVQRIAVYPAGCDQPELVRAFALPTNLTQGSRRRGIQGRKPNVVCCY